jgi:hypothetical protein
MRHQTLVFRLTAATAVAGLVLAQVIPRSALAQPAPPPGNPVAVPDQQTPDQQTADPPERAGWLSQVNGTVSYHTQDQDQWSPATMNYPVASGDAFWTEPNASARVAISSSIIALAGGTELDVGTLDFNGLQATMPQGEVYLHLRDLAQNETWSVQTPRGLVTVSGAGRYGVAAGDTQNPTTVTVLEGTAQVAGPGMSLQVAQGQTATITGTDTLQGSVGQSQTDAFLTAMQQSEQSPLAPAAAVPGPATAPPAVVAQIPGGDDLSAYGSWSQTTDNGEVWYPQVAAGWAPYQAGHWAYIQPWGWTWVDDAPWGFAPFHYGRWFQSGGRWGWTPGVVAVSGPPVYAPALVAFIGLGVGVGIGAALAGGSIGWVPLGPREAYHPWYHTSPRYLQSVNRSNVTNITVINDRNVTINNFVNRGAMTVVPASAMAESRPVRQVAQHVDPHMLETARPVIGTAPIRPTAATAGITPGLARQMHLPPAPAGVAAAGRVAPGPAFHAGPPGQSVATRPALRPAESRPGAVPEPAAARPAGTPERVEPGARPGVAAAPGEVPSLRTPAEREGGPPAIEHPAPVAGERHEATPVQQQRPGAMSGAMSGGQERPGEAGTRPPGASPAEHPPIAAPHPAGAPAAQTPGVVEHATPRPEEHAPAAQEHAVPRPEEHPAPVPEVHPAPRPEEHQAPRPEEHPAPRPQEQPAPRPEEHPAPRPEQRVAPQPEPHPAPAAHPAPPPHPAPGPHREDEKR